MPPPNALLRSAQRVRVSQVHIHDFLAPALFTPSSRRLLSSTPPTLATPTDIPSSPNGDGHASSSSAPPRGKLKPLTKEQRDFLSAALRVNQAGELAATLIYTAQTPPIIARHPHLRPLMKHMYDQEVGHFDTFNALIAKHRVRPTALYPLWSVMSYGLGWSTAVMGREAAMACTEAVETEIGDHYNSQIRTLLEMVSQWEAEGYEVGEELRTLINTLRRIRDEELEHLDHAVENDAKKAEPHWLLTGIIRAGCRGAIWVSERV
ncbi:putative ubiquinone biosynthesis protein coq7 protein [Phaeoacremonium minimum UCRPA7]|uniref:5-demethoxyubiquinone hydroxylase, mitochondrial n=1 Tax=Phaeoacremonium minimum (strain UCR-PA7) TaxID=1286976 RepID=R8BVQ3_PHAM7|nr:putative ubiquinone biosynthesis protein coq7 protein [Phaeoacremonium minimum UCRPA7]EOO03443.1 putative ubiquinone biosynthesis protein coq7 protein [Phaeoacremonium minimum UCRPA7]